MLIRGPFQLAWGNNPILDVTEIGFNYDVASNDYETVQGQTRRTEGAITASIDLTLLDSDIDALRTVLPQYYVPQGETLSTGETVTAEEGAIDIVAAKCDTSDTKYNLDIIACNGDVTRLVSARSTISGIDIQDNSVRTVTVSFIGEPEYIDGSPAGILQFFKKNGIEEES